MCSASQRYSRRRPRPQEPQGEDDEENEYVAHSQPVRPSTTSTIPSANNGSQSQPESESRPPPYTYYLLPPLTLTENSPLLPPSMKGKSQSDIDALVGDVLNFVFARASAAKAANDIIRLSDINSHVLANNRARGAARALLSDAARRIHGLSGLQVVELPRQPSADKAPSHAHSQSKGEKQSGGGDNHSDAFILYNPQSATDRPTDRSSLSPLARRHYAERAFLSVVLELVTWCFEGSIISEHELFTIIAAQCFLCSKEKFLTIDHSQLGNVRELIQHKFVHLNYLGRGPLKDSHQASNYGTLDSSGGTPYYYSLGVRTLIEFDLESRYRHSTETVIVNGSGVNQQTLKEIQRKEEVKRLNFGAIIASISGSASESQPASSASDNVVLPASHQLILRQLLVYGVVPELTITAILTNSNSSTTPSMIVASLNECLSFAHLSIVQLTFDVTGDDYLSLQNRSADYSNDSEGASDGQPNKSLTSFDENEIAVFKLALERLSEIEQQRGLAKLTRSEISDLIKESQLSKKKVLLEKLPVILQSLTEGQWLYEHRDSFQLSLGVKAQGSAMVIGDLVESYTCLTCHSQALYAMRCYHSDGDSDSRCEARLHVHCYQKMKARSKGQPVKCPSAPRSQTGHSFDR